MKFSTKQNVEAPSAFVFAALSDFDAWERMAMRRGAEVQRTDKLHSVQAGMAWHIKFQFRGKQRKVDLRLLNISPNSKLEFSAISPAIDATLTIEIMEMSALRSRMQIVSEVTPLTLTARLFIQSMRLARARADRKYAQRIADLAADIETRYRSTQPVS